MNGGGAKVWPGGATRGGVRGAGHLVLAMNGGGAGVGSAGVCGRPTSAVAQVPTQRSDVPA